MNTDIYGTQEYFIRYSFTQKESDIVHTTWVTVTRSEFFDSYYHEVPLNMLLNEVVVYLNIEENKYNIDIISCNKV